MLWLPIEINKKEPSEGAIIMDYKKRLSEPKHEDTKSSKERAMQDLKETVTIYIASFIKKRETLSLFTFSENNRWEQSSQCTLSYSIISLISFRIFCKNVTSMKWFDNVVLLFIALNCITLAMERPNIPPDCIERKFLTTANYIFTAVFAIEMFIKVMYI